MITQDLYRGSTLLWLLCYATFCSGQDIVVKPYLQDLCTDSVTIMWEATDVGIGVLAWGSTPFAMHNRDTSTSINVEGTSRIHTAVVSGLTPRQKYYYRVEMEGGQQTTFRTLVTLAEQADNESVQLMAISDMQRDGGQPDKFRDIIESGIIPLSLQEVGPSLHDLEAVLIPGDLVSTGGNYSQWRDHFFGPSDSLSGYVPFYPVPGNHEYFSGGLPTFKHYFSLPSNGATGLQDECWYKDISNVRVIGLNSNSGSTDQASQLQWLGQTLGSACSDADIDFVFAQLHHPYKSELWTPGENDFTGQVIDSLEQFTTACGKASLHFFGHTHGYSRGQSRDHKHLWVNVATAGGAIDNWGEFPNADYAEFVKSQDEYGFVYIDVTAGDEPQFVMQRYGIGDQDVVTANTLRDEVKIINYDIAPSQPVNIYPVRDSIDAACVALQASQFYGLEDSLQGAHWQVATDSLMTTLLAEEWRQDQNWYEEVNLQAGDDLTDIHISGLAGESTYYWRVRYRNQTLEWSPWSVSSRFYVTGGSDTLSSNLVDNPNAENGTAPWIGDIEALLNAQCNSVSPHQGSHNFGIGGICANESDYGVASQTIDLSTFAGQINADTVSMAWGGYLRNFSGTDIPRMYVELYEGSQLVVTSDSIEQTDDQWDYLSAIVKVPKGVSSCIVYLTGTRVGGQDNDSYFDQLNVHLIASPGSCLDCYGRSGIDSDLDGYCSDIDCDDNDAGIYPGALESCDGADNNCDMVTDGGDTATWTGDGDGVSWGDPTNWDQDLVPLPCQHVVIDDNASVSIEDSYQCRSIELGIGNTLSLVSGHTLIINSLGSNNYPSAVIRGAMHIDGKCTVKSSSSAAFEVYGSLTNNNKINTELIDGESVIVKSGGLFTSLGRTVFK